MSWYKMHRGWQEHLAFAEEPFTEREAWEWLISEASWDGKKQFNILSEPATLPRGQLSFALSFMAKAWQWDKASVSRYIKRIAEWGLIETDNERIQTVITICEYEKYQGGENEDETPTERKTNAKRNENETNYKNLRTKESIIIEGLGVSHETWQDFETHRKKLRKPMTDRARTEIFAKLEKFKQQGFSPHELLSTAIERGWLTVFEPRQHETTSRNNQQSKSTRAKQILANAVEESIRRDGQEDFSGSCLPSI
jgi:hypothetical protein